MFPTRAPWFLKFSGGTHDGSNPTNDIALGTKNIFGAANEYPWSSSVEVGTRSIDIYHIRETKLELITITIFS
jgi:hypothetical protein